MPRGGRPAPSFVSRGAAATAWTALAAFVLYGSVNTFGRDGAATEPLPGFSLPDIAQNLLLYVPFGVFGVWALAKTGSSHWRMCAAVTAIALVYSSGMELLQLASASRIASLLDVLANTAGAALGASASPAIDRALKRVADLVRPTGLFTARSRHLCAAVFIAIVFVAWYPFDITLDVSTLSERTRAVRRDPWLRPASSAEWWTQGGLFFVLTALLGSALPGLGKYVGVLAAITVSAAAVLIDLGQLAMGRHAVGGSILAAQMAGAGVAAVLMSVWKRRQSR